VIKVSDHIVDMGLEGGQAGGQIVNQGTPEQVVKSGKGHTAAFLKDEMAFTRKVQGKQIKN
jgi:excinuclease ABC subunit A